MKCNSEMQETCDVTKITQEKLIYNDTLHLKLYEKDLHLIFTLFLP